MRETSYLTENRKVLGLLRKIKQFETFSDGDLRSFLDIGKLRHYEPGEVIIREGARDCWVYFLLSGEVGVYKEGTKVKTLNCLGDLFGEMGVVDGAPRSATIKTEADTLVLGVDGSLIDHMFKTNELTFCYTIYRLFSEVLAERLRITTEENSRLKDELESVRQRLRKTKEEAKRSV
ncbi:MAG: cyclic nucleotide-binding domain-containing protein [Desulfobulbaceae bacterium]|nr:cyclic nucleotide-binding domain-containing protein [Desulfobulbaceae bacterium]